MGTQCLTDSGAVVPVGRFDAVLTVSVDGAPFAGSVEAPVVAVVDVMWKDMAAS